MTRQKDGHPTVLRVDGVLDVPAAQRLAASVTSMDGGEIRIDLTRVREFHDLAVAQLGRSLAGRQGVFVVGLRQHHIRLLRYLGISTGSTSPDALLGLA